MLRETVPTSEAVPLRDYIEQIRADLEKLVSFRLLALQTLLDQDRLGGQARLVDRVQALEVQLGHQLAALESKLDAYCASHIREHDSLAGEKARLAAVVDGRLGEINALRAQVSGERALLVTRDQLDAMAATLRERMDSGLVLQNPQPALEQLRSRLEQTEQARSNIEGRFWALGAGMSALVVIINIALAILLKGWK